MIYYERVKGHISTEYRTAHIRKHGFMHYEVVRVREDGAYDWFTSHFTSWGAKKAVDAYIDERKIIGNIV